MAFAGFVPTYEQPTHCASCVRQRVIAWGQQALEGILLDDEDAVRLALLHPLADVNAQLEGDGSLGVPFSLGGAGLFTREQVDDVTQGLKASSRDALRSKGGFFTSLEWARVDEVLCDIGRYVPNVAMPRAVPGDTGLSIAIRLGRLRAGSSYLAAGCDPVVKNNQDATAVDILLENVSKLEALLEKIEALQCQALDSRRPPLTTAQSQCIKAEERVREKISEYKELAVSLMEVITHRLDQMDKLRKEASACTLILKDIPEHVLQELNKESILRQKLMELRVGTT
jgi:hypothetical protein